MRHGNRIIRRVPRGRSGAPQKAFVPRIVNRSGLGELPYREVYEQGQTILDPGGGITDRYWNTDRLTVFPFSVDTTSLQIIPDNGRRAYFVVQNTSAANIFVNFGQSATANSFRIPTGGFFEQIGVGGMFGTGGFVTSLSIHIIGSVAGLTGVVMEGIRSPEWEAGRQPDWID